MKVYLVEMDNGELYEDYYRWTEKVFTTYRGASQYLLDEDYTPYPEVNYETNEYYLVFTDEDDEGRTFDAEVTEMEVEEYSSKD